MYSNKPDKNQYTAFLGSKRTLAVFVIIFAVISTTLVFSKTAHADFLSFMSMLMGNQEVSAKLIQPRVADSQTSSMIVLQAAVGANQLAQAAEAPPPFEGNTSLSPDIARMNATSTEIFNTQISIYVVRQGDAISSVAKMFNVSVNTVLWANNINSRTILQPGRTLVILPVTGITHKVKSGDSIQSIAKKYGADVGDILNYNDFTLGTALKIDSEIMIPDAEMPATAVSGSKNITRTPSEPLLDGRSWPSYPGYYSCPVPGARLSQGLHGHNGIDLAAPRGTPVRTAADGTVIINRTNGAWNGGYGNFVVVIHANGTQTLYSHMSKGAVRVGELVSRGQTIGYVGSTGLSTGPHLHLEVRGARNPFVDAGLCQ